MKKAVILSLLIVLSWGCSKDGFSNQNPYLPNYGFSMEVNTNLPSYNSLLFTGNSVRVYPVNGPTNGVILFYTGSTYNAFDGSCPNQNITTCSKLTLSGSNAHCECEAENYNLFNGQTTGKPYGLKQYRVQVNGNVITVYN
jgi:nitrite reductase/ring-hydroxylating ferredoxin subunit